MAEQFYLWRNTALVQSQPVLNEGIESLAHHPFLRMGSKICGFNLDMIGGDQRPKCCTRCRFPT